MHASSQIGPAADRPGLLVSAAILGRDIKLAHSVFALPFAVLAALLAMPPGAPSSRYIGTVEIIVVCMILARTWAMLVNRIADRRIDARNPRTRGRAIASGRVTPARAVALAGLSAIGFIGATGLFLWIYDNPWPLILSIPVLAWIGFYSFTKRFSSLCHLVLGSALAASPLAAAIAVGGIEALIPGTGAGHAALPILALGAMVMLWVAGFDVIYALADLEFDRQEGLHSIPARLGWRHACMVSRVLHALALVALGWVWWAEPRFGLVFLTGVMLVAGVLVAEHLVLARRGKDGLDIAFFTLNGVVSIILGVMGSLDTFLWSA